MAEQPIDYAADVREWVSIWGHYRPADAPRLYAPLIAYVPGLTPEQAALVMDVVSGTCPGCKNGPSDCQCWNDE